jgi:hypothetical protein
MVYEKFLIKVKGLNESLLVYDVLQKNGATNKVMIVGGGLICLDGVYSVDELIELFYTIDLNIQVNYLNTKITNDIVWAEDIIKEFIDKADISNDVNHFLDLINERGGQEYLTPKELQRLNEISIGTY